jgi:dTDP-4-amino-4,6-dideoxygalactose transaminase
VRNRVDTVEEFWDQSDINEAYDRSSLNSIESFASEFCAYLDVKPSSFSFFPSGRLALQELLQSRADNRNTVLVPAFNCKCVQSSIRTAGHQIKLYDFSSEFGCFDWDKIINLITPSIGTVIVTHYFGVPYDFIPLHDFCKKRNIAIIEDCAHTLGGHIDGRIAGTIGDASIFSFNYDKPISLGWGGAMLINNPRVFNYQPHNHIKVLPCEKEMKLIRAFQNKIFFHRLTFPYYNSKTFRILNKLRLFNKYKFTVPADYSIGKIQAELGKYCLNKFQNVSESRSINASYFDDQTSQKCWPVGNNISPSWLKQKVFVDNSQSLLRISHKALSQGIRIGNYNWPWLFGDSDSIHCVNSKKTASYSVDVPIHQNLSTSSLGKIVSLFE